MDKYWTVLYHGKGSKTPGKIAIEATYGDHVWDSPIYEVVGYGDTFPEARDIAIEFRKHKPVDENIAFIEAMFDIGFDGDILDYV